MNEPLDINFGRVWGASGVQGFFGEGYPYHRLPFGPRFSGLTFVAKTATWWPRSFPRKVHVGLQGLWHGYALNSVRLSNPGIRVLFEDGRWQDRKEPFFISFA